MLTENRKRQLSGGDEESGHLVPQAKRQNRAHPLSPEPGRDAWDSESSNSESSISSPEHASGSCGSQCVVGPCCPLSSGGLLRTGPPYKPGVLPSDQPHLEACPLPEPAEPMST